MFNNYYSRRQILKGSAGLAATSLLNACSFNMLQQPTDLTFEEFQIISVFVTGFDKETLFPPLDPIQIGKVYYTVLMEKTPKTTLTSLAKAMKQHSVEQLSQLNDFTDVLGNVAIMWYLGQWRDLNDKNISTVISSMAYTQGLAWQVAQAHPMGYSEFTFGYWSEAPSKYSNVNQGVGA
jgi:hypothetical protein